MRKRWKQWAMVASGLLGLGGLAAPAHAQFMPPAGPPPSFGSDPQMPVPPDFPNPGAAPKEDSPFSLRDEGRGNAFTDGCGTPVITPWIWITPEGFGAIQKRGNLNTVLVTSANNPNPNTSVGALGQPGTVQLFGGNSGIDTHVLGGGRATIGVDAQQFCWFLLPMEFSIFYLGQTSNNFGATSDFTGAPLLARPVFATNLASETVYLSSFPNGAVGSISVNSSTRFWGFDYNFLGKIGRDCYQCADNFCNLDLIAGFRYADLQEYLQINSTATSIDPTFGVFFVNTGFGQGNTTIVNDSFGTHNRFYGGNLGARINAQRGYWFASVTGKIAVGAVHQEVDINGYSSLVNGAGTVNTVNGGILAVASNSGLHQRTVFAVLPEGNLTIGYQISSCLRFQAGYTVTYLSNVVRPGDTISRRIDTRQIPTDFTFNPSIHPNTPGFTFNTTDYWIQGITLGVTLSF